MHRQAARPPTRLPLALATAALAALAALGGLPACGGEDGGETGDADACGRFEYQASGTGTCEEGCSLQCECPESVPTSVAKCTQDGCIVSGNCEEICKAELSEAVGCASTYASP